MAGKWEKLSVGLKWTADRINLFACFLVLAAAVCLFVPFFVPNTPPDGDRAIAFVLVAMLFVSFAFLLTLFAALMLLRGDSRLYLRQILYQSAAFIVLSFSLRAFGMHDSVDAALRSLIFHNTASHAYQPAGETISSPRSVAELSSIMILFILIEISAFVARDVEEAKLEVSKAIDKSKETVDKVDEVVKSINRTAEQIGQLKLVTSVAALDQEVMHAAVDLISLWSDRAPNAGLPRKPGPRVPTELADQCWRVLMREYLQEEKRDFNADITAGVPSSVRPLGGAGQNYERSDVSYIATNIGFYATFLSALVTELNKRKANNQKVCIAVVTNVLPAHWWNWTFKIHEWRAYEEISNLRKKMIDIAKGGARIDRLIAVWSDGKEEVVDEPSYEPYQTLWSEHLLYDMLTQWYLIDSSSDDGTLPSSETFNTFAKAIGDELERFPPPIKAGARCVTAGARIYPMIRKKASEAEKTYSARSETWKERQLAEAYGDLYDQGQNGKYWALPIDAANFATFQGHFDAMFIGIGPKDAGNSDRGLWADGDEVEWGMCLMNSADAAVETMFLTVISGLSARQQFEYWRGRILKDQISFDWSKNLLPNKAIELAKKLSAKQTQPNRSTPTSTPVEPEPAAPDSQLSAASPPPEQPEI